MSGNGLTGMMMCGKMILKSDQLCKRLFVFKSSCAHNFISLLYTKSLAWTCRKAVVELVAPQLPGGFWARDFVFLSNGATK